MSTADVIEFWVTWCERQNVERNYGMGAIDAGRVLIAEDAAYWADHGMRHLLDAVIQNSQAA